MYYVFAPISYHNIFLIFCQIFGMLYFTCFFVSQKMPLFFGAVCVYCCQQIGTCPAEVCSPFSNLFYSYVHYSYAYALWYSKYTSCIRGCFTLKHLSFFKYNLALSSVVFFLETASLRFPALFNVCFSM